MARGRETSPGGSKNAATVRARRRRARRDAAGCAVRALTRNGDFNRARGQRDHRRSAARRVLRRGHGRGDDLLRHARHRQHRPPGLYHARLVRRLYAEFELRPRPGADRRGDDAAVLSARDRGLSDLLLCFRAARRGVDPGPRLFLWPVVCRRGGADPDLWRRLPLCRGARISVRACISAMSTCRCAC